MTENLIKWNPDKYAGWNYEDVPSDPTGWTRFYWKASEANHGRPNGFEFCSFQVSIGGAKPDWKPFTDSESYVEMLFHGTACFDGIRHLWLGDESSNNLGYYHYADLRIVEWVLNKLKELESKYCPESDRVKDERVAQ